MYVKGAKLNRLKKVLCCWNKDVFGNIPDKVKLADELVAQMEVLANRDDVCQEELCGVEAISEVELDMEEEFWRQKSSIWWLKDGDRCSKFFHASVKAKRSRLAVHRIKDVSGVWIDNKEDIEFAALEHFSHLS
ncbi:reverse transcriptase [Quillaja saponaria]|uniref:Reverse transcriptase n=1 Tax=Quillaja saponaria TaxID=32244 RepID=A0AAD7M5Q8_QUISA|nr:reverse transcriptase [Quillaja saponaria]